ncbi:diguanylate cyclase domain-containing protein [Shewanella loihica]|uniref:Diguanylate cyclase n=1 Tax=Shewanella loihica (strain ATCC BAA-1088 / PV-4) TaxID=323850 RepID=A3QFU0_SHELP|nr:MULTISPECIES: diguanylate cyclase [Shewanella]ABO24338.1 diguanylate cyclase [Shewanella loihica PV-4]QYJ81167.1 GGDEF domain-containing protein [Shewanella aegiceratis]QYJ92523.1 GGDEF domain-containing protein [Shewanella spartinae]QYJ96406.1 GGDEF domain-containing protein [Shewanella alkalitolerans]QYK11654.1 GGDEF domain-containing protein [Shewanella rhizosphaerae]
MIYSFSNSGFRDPETGVYNQTYFMEVFNREWHRHMRERQTLALLYLCPHIHETVKQPHLLELFMKQVQEAILRTTDMVARLNQDNFALGLFNIDREGTEIVIARIEQKIMDFNQDYQRKHSNRIDYELAGCLCQPESDLNIENLFEDVRSLTHTLEGQKEHHTAMHCLN